MSSYKGKVVAVTGAASGLALEISKQLAARGAWVSMGDVHQENLDKAVETVKQTASPDAKVRGYQVDVRKTASVDGWIEQTVKDLGKLHGAANFAGTIGTQLLSGGIVDVDDDDWDFVMSINLTGVMKCMRAQIRNFSPDGGAVINASSILGVVGGATREAYSASKHGVIGLSRSAAKELGGQKIRVNTVNPGYIHTPMMDAASGGNTEALNGTPEVQATIMKRLGKPHEVASLVVFLLGDDATFITGASYQCDGGWAC